MKTKRLVNITVQLVTVNMSKHFVFVFIVLLLICVYTINVLPNSYKSEDQLIELALKVNSKIIAEQNVSKLRHILLWTDRNNAPFDMLTEGRSSFIKQNCKFTNCYVTGDRNYLDKVTDYAAIVFNQKQMSLYLEDLPTRRSSKQKYVFASTESSHYYPVCHDVFKGFYNWSWTYRLDSDIQWRYITIYDLHGNVVGPDLDMEWPKTFQDIDEGSKLKLKSKHVTAGWFVSNCRSRSRREQLVGELESAMSIFNLTLDIVGRCGKKSCERRAQLCYKWIEKDYYFYLSFENSVSEDYVTEKLLNALNNFAVPIVFGGANYSRFLPPGSYLDARELGPLAVAKKMHQIVNNKSLYLEYHRWRNNFKYKDTLESAVCDFCEALNDPKMFGRQSVHHDIAGWWNGHLKTTYC